MFAHLQFPYQDLHGSNNLGIQMSEHCWDEEMRNKNLDKDLNYDSYVKFRQFY